ncbi:hypothetical protein CT0861_06257 [Colletotrichum tofieldiae]|uniref:AA1-like domain-containing protein n=1 Tax=Colletotrichum tofieldiae TaxID=708197 RepID=A0A166MK23_9PEZI|nr:hypothetical protein CT0861_06257 [Colletotrichum tofieldiae]
MQFSVGIVSVLASAMAVAANPIAAREYVADDYPWTVTETITSITHINNYYYHAKVAAPSYGFDNGFNAECSGLTRGGPFVNCTWTGGATGATVQSRWADPNISISYVYPYPGGRSYVSTLNQHLHLI